MATAAKPTATHIAYDDLYARWEKGNWRATEVDFEQDKTDWRDKLSEIQRRSAMWQYAMFFYGEDSVTDNLTPYIDAAPHEEQKYFLATQQVDEARHAVFFSRFWREVIERGDSIGSALDATLPELNWGYRKVFGRLDKMADELRKDRSKPKLAAAITLYHFVVEASLAQPGQHYIEDSLERIDALPGFCAGMRNVSLDEQRHIGFGVRMLHDLCQEDPDCQAAVGEILREVTPWAAGVFIPPGWDEEYVHCWDFTLKDIFSFGMESLDSKLRAAGLPPEELGVPFYTDIPYEERAERGLAMLKAGLLGEKMGPPKQDPDAIFYMFDGIRRMADPGDAERITVQWDFSDAEPWFLRVDNGDRRVEQGRVEEPDITLQCRFEDWVDVAAGREDPRRALLRGKLRPRGKLRTLWRTRNMFA